MESVTLAKIAGTYINLQDAYAVEGNKLGSWQAIGYSAPGEKKSDAGNSMSYETTNLIYTEGDVTEADWTATPKVKLNDCTTDKKWSFKSVFSPGEDTDQGNYSLSFEDNDSDGECKGLTASWDNILNAKR